jgi:hypothetical protein
VIGVSIDKSLYKRYKHLKNIDISVYKRMKYYETHFEEYISSMNQCNLHPEMSKYRDYFPEQLSNFGNLIVYGSSGIGKYSQVLRLLQKYSPSSLKYEKHMIMQTEKQTYIYRISDVHYEIDMALLGCNSKIIWHEIFSQIVDIISMKSDKNGIIVCKNFHSIHTELLDIFYSYMQQYNHPQLNIHIKFILLTEHISFISSRILNSCHIIHVKRPSKELYEKYICKNTQNQYTQSSDTLCKLESSVELPTLHTSNNRRLPPPPPPPILGQRGSNKRVNEMITLFHNNNNVSKDSLKQPIHELFVKHICKITQKNDTQNNDIQNNDTDTILGNIQPCDILNLKELKVLQLSKHNDKDSTKPLPKEIFNSVCDAIIQDLTNTSSLSITSFRDTLYDILIYNVDAIECFWYILSHFIQLNRIRPNDVSHILDKTFTFLKYYNNNYRPIYHLENIFLLLLTKIN